MLSEHIKEESTFSFRAMKNRIASEIDMHVSPSLWFGLRGKTPQINMESSMVEGIGPTPPMQPVGPPTGDIKLFGYYVFAAGDNLATKGKLGDDWTSAQFFWSDMTQAQKDAALQKVLNSSDIDKGIFAPKKDLFAQLNDLANRATMGEPGPDKIEVGKIFGHIGQIFMES